MVFSSAIFLFIFLPVVFTGHLLIRPLWGKNLFLIFASLLFYAFGEPVYVFLMILSALANYISGLLLGNLRGRSSRRFVLLSAVTLNVVVLGMFKYAGFIVDDINRIFGARLPVPQIALPVGISFFTFQALSYVIDVYRDACLSQKDFFRVLLYLSFFPQLIAGPIVRWSEISHQIESRRMEEGQIVYGIGRFVHGLFKKLVFANGLGRVADEVFSLQIQDHGMLVAWLGAVCYALQIFYDFSGYSDMAIGLAAMFGFHFQENFDHPYSADSIRGFWRRWHISLSGWFREYVYIPLGGNRKGKLRTEGNKLIVFLLTGIWHGADWTFVIWGLFHGVMNVLEDTVLPVRSWKWKWAGNLYTWIVAVTAFVMFRADTVSQGWQMIRTMYSDLSFDLASRSFLLEQLSPYIIFLLAGGLFFSYPVTARFRACVRPLVMCHPLAGECLRYVEILLLLLCSLCGLASSAYDPFIYFRF